MKQPTHGTALLALLEHSRRYPEKDGAPSFVSVSIVGSDEARVYTVAARIPLTSPYQQLLAGLLPLFQWPAKIEGSSDCWSVVFSVCSTELSSPAELTLFDRAIQRRNG